MSEVEFPGAIDPAHKIGIFDFINVLVPSGDMVKMIEALFNHWDQVIDRDQMVRGSNSRRLDALRAERDEQDGNRQALDDEIAELERGQP